VTGVATSDRCLGSKPLARTAKQRRWSSLKRSRRFPSCSRKNSIFFSPVLDRLVLALVHPAGNGDQDDCKGSSILGMFF